MSNAREIKTKIGSVQNTQKITRAMELVAASKMRRATEQMSRSKAYSGKIRTVIAHVAHAHSEYQHPYMKVHEEVKRVGYIIVATDRGLCGGLNINLFKTLLKHMRENQDKGVEIDLCLIGNKAMAFFKRFGGNIKAHVNHLGDKPKLADLVGSIKLMLDDYDQGHLHSLFLASNVFVNTMIQQPTIQQLLPLEADEKTDSGYWDYIYEPDSAEYLLTLLLKRYIESQVYQSVVENLACEQAARMVAMKSATDNAGDIINELDLAYNKARQASITREISEIVSGADAIG